MGCAKLYPGWLWLSVARHHTQLATSPALQAPPASALCQQLAA